MNLPIDIMIFWDDFATIFRPSMTPKSFVLQGDPGSEAVFCGLAGRTLKLCYRCQLVNLAVGFPDES